MGRPGRRFPQAKIIVRGESKILFWTWQRERYQLSLGPDDDIGLYRDELNLALRRGQRADFPAWALARRPDGNPHHPAVHRYLTALLPSAPAGIPPAFVAHLRANTSERQAQQDLNRLQLFADQVGGNPLAATHEQVARYLVAVVSQPAQRYLADQLTALLGDKERTLSDLAAELTPTDASVDQARKMRATIAAALKNRRRFTRVGHGIYARGDATPQPRSPATRNRILMALRKFYRWALREGLIVGNPVDGLRSVAEQESSEIVWLTHDEGRALLAAATEAEDRAIWLALLAGLRRAEIFRLEWQNVHLDARWIRIVGVTKTKKVRDVPVNHELVDYLAAVPAAQRRGPVVPWPRDIPAWEQAVVRQLARLSSILPPLAEKINFNALRHTFCSWLAQTGQVSIDQIAAISGHTPGVCRRHYAHLIPADPARTGIDLLFGQQRK